MTDKIPLEAKTFEYVPEPLRAIPGAPVLRLRYGTRRDKHNYKAEIAARGLVSYSDEEIRQAMLDEIRRLSANDEDAKTKMVDCAERYWAANKSLEAEIKLWRDEIIQLLSDEPEAEIPDDPVIDFDPEEAAWIVGIFQTVSATSKVIGNMNKANSRRDFTASEVALSIVLVDVEGFRLERDIDGLVTNLADLEEWLGDRAEELGIEPIRAGYSYSDLLSTAFIAFHLPKDAEKNSASLLPATSDRNGSQPAAEESASTSLKSEKSTETPCTTADTTTGETSSTSPSPAAADLAESSGPMAEA